MTDTTQSAANTQAATHTPGPWERSSSINGRVLALFRNPDGDAYFWEIATATSTTFPADDGGLHMAGGTMKANARLIAEAADKALDDCERWLTLLSCEDHAKPITRRRQAMENGWDRARDI